MSLHGQIQALNKTIIFVGCNKGIDAARLFAQYDKRKTPFEASRWQSQINKYISKDKQQLQGACFPSETDRQHVLKKGFSQQHESTAPQLHCVEPLPANVKILQQVAKDIRVSPAFFHIHHAAVGASSDPPTIPFPDTSSAGAGEESVGVDFYKAGQGKGDIEHRVQVKHTSTDELFKNSQKIDMLLVDTEGNDPLVLLGSARVLQSVRYLEFENHKVGAWIKFDLKWIISYLDNLGMDCYWSGNDGGLFRITRCWHDVYSKAKL